MNPAKPRERRWQRSAVLVAFTRRAALALGLPVAVIALCVGFAVARDMARLAEAGLRLPEEGYSWSGRDVLHNAKTLVGHWSISVPRVLMQSPQDPAFHSKLPVYEIFVRRSELEKLEASLPQSGRQYVRAVLKHGTRVERIKLRYRGLLGYHWGGPKRSMRVRLRSGRFLDGDRYINFVNPEGTGQTHNLLADRLAEELGLLSPEAELVHLRVNNRFYGVMYKHAQLNEYFLRKKGYAPGDLYAGEGYNEDAERWGRMRSVWLDVQAWRKVASSSPETERDLGPIEGLVDLVRDSSDEEFRRGIWSVLDRDNFVRFVALHNLVGSIHSDDKHNWRLYLNPIDGRFRAIPWDLGHAFEPVSLDHPSSKLHERVYRLDPEFVEDRNRLLWQFLEGPGVSRMREILDGELARAEPDLRADYQKHVWRSPGSVPLPTSVMREDWKEESSRIDALARRIREQLGDSAADVYWTPGDGGTLALSVVARGVSGVRILDIELRSDAGAACGGTLYRDIDGDGALSERDQRVALGEELLLPGRGPFSEAQLTASTLTWHPTQVLGRRDWRMDPEPRAYRFVLATEGPKVGSLSLRVANSVTGEARVLAAIQASGPTGTLPGDYRPREQPANVEVRFGRGVHVIDHDLILAPNETLVVEPGAVLRLASGVSIVARYPFRIVGTESEPAVIQPADTEEPWGVIACRECGPQPSEVRHARISGGREATQGLVHYTGMLAVHYGGLVIEDSVISESRGEDLVNVKKGRLEMRNVVMGPGAGDLLDVDFATAAISHSLFRDAANECVDVGSSEVRLSQSVLQRCGDKGISVGPEGDVAVETSLIEESVMGMAVKDGSRVTFDESRIASCPVSVALYRKNLKYGGRNTALLRATEIVSSGAPRVSERRDRLELRSCWGEWRGQPRGPIWGRLLPGPVFDSATNERLWARLRVRDQRVLP